MPAQYAQAVGHIYFYEPGGSYESRSTPCGVATVTWRGPSSVWVSAAHGALDVREACALLREMGVERVEYEHRGKLRTLTARPGPQG